MRKVYEQWDGEYLVKYARIQEHRYTTVIHSEQDGDILLSGEWREDKHLAADSLLDKIHTYECGWYYHEPRTTACATRFRVIELKRLHKSQIIWSKGHFAPAERKPIYTLTGY